MIVKAEQVDYFKQIAKDQYMYMVIDEFGEESLDTLIKLTDTIVEIYKYLNYNSFKEVIIAIPIEPHIELLNSIDMFSHTSIFDFQSLVKFNGHKIIIEISNDGSLKVCIHEKNNLNFIESKAIIYQYKSPIDEEQVLAGSNLIKLKPIPGADTYFSIQTYKELELALEAYETKIARYSNCSSLREIWLSNEKVFLKPQPESGMRNSLTNFLKIHLRGDVEVRPEQNTDDSHPVDIKITWGFVNRIALIEIKWLGKSLPHLGGNFSANWTESRARSGASQLSEYLNNNQIQAPLKITKGYLVVYDARRRNTNNHTTTVNSNDGLHYLNKEIVYNPKYHEIRQDFAEPKRFFLEPIINYTI
ncbi:MAG: hypothetical protein R2776_05365 [Flavobacteriaceae bacterium]